jgi:hypothetical protein
MFWDNWDLLATHADNHEQSEFTINRGINTPPQCPAQTARGPQSGILSIERIGREPAVSDISDQ